MNKSVNYGTKNLLRSRLSIQRSAIFTLLVKLSKDNEEYFTVKNGPSNADKFRICCTEILFYAPMFQELLNELQRIAPDYDFDVNTPGNGFRTLVCLSDMVVLHLVSILRNCIEYRSSAIFRASYHCKDLTNYCDILKYFVRILEKLMPFSKKLRNSSLFPPLDEDCPKSSNLFKTIESIDTSCFFGRSLGFQYPPSVARVLRIIGILLASYSVSLEKGQGRIESLIKSSRFIFDPEQCAIRIHKVSREADVEFCKGFWNLSELGDRVPRFIFCPNMAICETRELSAGPLLLESTDGSYIDIPEPSSYTGKRPVSIRILSYSYRKEMSQGWMMPQNYIGPSFPPSPNLLFHCHGGGYVATSSKSHEIYLRNWAKQLDCSILSVDYSLAPENPFPRAVEEALYVYAYAINNSRELGWNGENMCMVGDSAGGNLIVALNLKLIQLNVRHRPIGIIPIYAPFIFQFLPSPSRLLSLMDPLLNTGLIMNCLAAYAIGDVSAPEATESIKKPHKSLQDYVDDVRKLQRSHNLNFNNSSSIVSLVNLASSSGHKSDGSISSSKTNLMSRSGKEDHSSEHDMEDCNNENKLSLSALQVKSDSSQIHLSSKAYDQRLINYLKTHPITKDALTLPDDEKCTENELLEFGSTGSSTCDPFELQSIYENPISNIHESKSSVNIEEFVQRDLGMKRSFSQNLADTAMLAADHALDNLSNLFKQAPIDRNKMKLGRTASLMTRSVKALQAEKCEDDVEVEVVSRWAKLIDEWNSKIPRDPLISPLYASDEELSSLPPIWFVACHLDPLLDDTITFARRIRSCGGKVIGVDLLDNLPHGFLNLSLVSAECREGVNLCLSRIQKIFALDTS